MKNRKLMALCALAALTLALLIGLAPPAKAVDDPFYLKLEPAVGRMGSFIKATLMERSPDPTQPDSIYKHTCYVVWYLSRDGVVWDDMERQYVGPWAEDDYLISTASPWYNYGYVEFYTEADTLACANFTLDHMLGIYIDILDPVPYGDSTPLVIRVIGGRTPYKYRVDYMVHENTTSYHFSETGESPFGVDEFTVHLPLCPGNGMSVKCHITDILGREGDSKTMHVGMVGAPVGEAMRVVSRQQSAAGALPDETVRAEMNIEGGDMPYDGWARWYVKPGGGEEVYDEGPLPFADAHTNLFGKLPASLIQKYPGLQKFYLGLTINDVSGRVFRPSPFEFLVYHILSADSAVVPPAATQDGQVTARITVKGGTPPYTGKFSWKVYAKDSDPAHLFTKSVEVTSSTGTLSNTLDLKGLDWAHLDDSGEVLIEVWDSAQGYTGDQYVHWFRILRHPMTRGDANDDGRINMEDLTHILDHMIRHAILISPEGADANADGVLNDADLKWIIDRVVK